ncbi:MAG: hypothetical protein K2N85_09205, partial [Lachnospiraceae bacterium]|nr:hypothetical protein [Lachnospiraceae bacterium]
IFGSEEDAENYLKGISDVTGAINWGGVIDNDDLPFWGLSKALSDVIARAPDIGIGSIGAGTLVNDWADDIPFVGLTDIQDYVDKLNDVIDGIRDGVIDGTFDLTNDIPDTIVDPYTDAWDDVIDNSIPADDPRVYDPTQDKPITGDKPIAGDKPITTPAEDVIDIPLLVPELTSDFSDISDTLKKKFPFSLPWDLHYLLTGLASTPKTPVYYLPLVIERLGINETIVIDMSDFEDLSKLSRAMLSFIWAYVLINWTVKIVSVRKED